MESIFGPVSGGYHVAAYANSVEGDPPGYLGYYKICLLAPLNYWEAGSCVFKGCAPGCHPDPAQAVHAALAAAVARTDIMPATGDYPQWAWERIAEATRRYGGHVAR
jgi:hypothetical protein